MFLKGEGTVQGYSKVDRVGTVLEWCSRPFDVKWTVGFTVPEIEGADLGLCRVGMKVAVLVIRGVSKTF